ncbi:glucose-methanol-choline oxidoreductase-like protein [Massariosphaeria phaeospora]|uniref:Glucose-methanol-choline oxidoreductase-like protein n=1 Tax=Massariosphaeria phaeospora TaxID=100035 RepID=A0A7C8M3H9_9PLEO|nr:glucose-methanol-choline oxidoreductase-like protein [Massariosphaeria phaeospora]
MRGTNTYDYIVCGGGTAGCVLASRLAEDANCSVLLIEAGKPKTEVPASAIPAGVSQILGTDADWNIQSEPCEELNGRRLHLGRGKFLGGSSGCNGTLCIRGTPQDYDDWGVEGWSGAEVFGHMKKVESFQNKPWFEADATAHGTDGPLLTEPHDLAPISSLVLESFQSKGLPLTPDMFSTGETARGCGHAVRSVRKGVRSTAVDYLGDRVGDNVEVRTNLYVDKVVLEKTAEGDWHAASVRVQDADGAVTDFTARKEIVLTAGAYGSPAILLRSGIGPKCELEELGIETTLDLPGVGKNLQDHMVMLSFYEVTKPDITNDHLIWHTGAREKTIEEYKTSRTGFFSQFPFGVFAFARLDDRLADNDLWRAAGTERTDDRDALGTLASQAHVEFWNTECYSPKYMFKDFPPDGKYAFAMATTFFSPRSRGEVTLTGMDPRVNPKVQHNFLSDPLDMLVFSEGCRMANEIALEGKGTKDVIAGSWPVAHGHDRFTQREQWQEAIRQRADTCYHPGGSCKMGNADDETAVVDARLRVRGIRGLRVADASIMPTLPTGHPQMPVFAIAEKAAEMIESDSSTGGSRRAVGDLMHSAGV